MMTYPNFPNGEQPTPHNRSGGGAPTVGHAVHDYFATDEIFQRVAASADEEIGKPVRLLFLSGLAAGLSIGLSFIAHATMTAKVPGDTSGLIGSLLYPIGFLLIVMGRYQLFTENTLTPVTLVLTRIASLPMLLRNWGVVLAANLVGAAIIALVLATTDIFEPSTAEVALGFGRHGIETDWWALFFKGIIAGWLVASMVWLIHASQDTITRFFLVYVIMFLVPAADLYHCVIGACEALYLVFKGGTDIFTATFGFFAPVVLGNIVGGVGLVGILNYAQTRETRFPDRDCGVLELTWREWLFGWHSGSPDQELNPGHAQVADGQMFDVEPTLAEAPHADDHAIGREDAPYTVVQYGDYECPTSRTVYYMVRDLEDRLGTDIRYIFRHMPLTRQHPYAMQAALAAEAADAQGKFWDMHHRLFATHHELHGGTLHDHAEELGLDIEQFDAALESNNDQPRVEKDIATAIRSGVRTTRNLFVNGRRYYGEFDVDTLRKAIERYANAEAESSSTDEPMG